MDRSEKETLVNSLRETIQNAGLVVVTRQSGLTVAEVSDLRSKMRESGSSYKVVKNTLARLAIQGTPYESLADLLTGPTALAISEDAIAAARVAVKFSETNDKIEVVGGCMGGNVLDVRGIEALAKLPSLNELRGKIIGVISAPATKITGVLQAPAGQLARVFSAYSSSK